MAIIIVKTFILSSNTDETINKSFESIIKEYDRTEDQMEESIFCFKFTYLSNIRCKKVNFQE